VGGPVPPLLRRGRLGPLTAAPPPPPAARPPRPPPPPPHPRPRGGHGRPAYRRGVRRHAGAAAGVFDRRGRGAGVGGPGRSALLARAAIAGPAFRHVKI